MNENNKPSTCTLPLLTKIIKTLPFSIINTYRVMMSLHGQVELGWLSQEYCQGLYIIKNKISYLVDICYSIRV